MVLMTVGGVGPGQSSRAFLRALLIPSRLRSVSFVSFCLHCRCAVADVAAAIDAALLPCRLCLADAATCALSTVSLRGSCCFRMQYGDCSDGS
jgi:hypothetical protein